MLHDETAKIHKIVARIWVTAATWKVLEEGMAVLGQIVADVTGLLRLNIVAQLESSCTEKESR